MSRHRRYYKRERVKFYSLAVLMIMASGGMILYNSGYLFYGIVITVTLAAVVLVIYVAHCNIRKNMKDRQYLDSSRYNGQAVR